MFPRPSGAELRNSAVGIEIRDDLVTRKDQAEEAEHQKADRREAEDNSFASEARNRITQRLDLAGAGALDWVDLEIAAADTLKRVSLELGGKGANLIFADADDKAVKRGVIRCMNNTGQSCNAPTRMLVERSVYDRAVEIARETAAATTVGNPAEEGRHIGPLVSALQFDRALAWGMKLDRPSGLGVRFEPGMTKTVRLVAFVGNRQVIGEGGLAQGPLDRDGAREAVHHNLVHIVHVRFPSRRALRDLPS